MNNTFATPMCFAREPSPASRVLRVLGLHPDFITRGITGLMNLAFTGTTNFMVFVMATGAQTVGILLGLQAKLRSLTASTSRADS